MNRFFQAIFGWTRSSKQVEADKVAVKKFRRKYANFRKLLEANAALGELMADMDARLSSETLFGFFYIKDIVEQTLRLCRRMCASLIAMGDGRYADLTERVDSLDHALSTMLEESAHGMDCPHLTMPFGEIMDGQTDWVGGKNANLAALCNRAGVRVPRGFAITVAAYRAFLAQDGLDQMIEKQLAKMDPQDLDRMGEILEEIRLAIEAASLPPEVTAALDAAWEACYGQDTVRVAVRSSAQVEDGAKSFAGQFISELNISRNNLADSYKRVVASLFSPPATIYRLHQGIPLASSAMAVVCLEMVDVVASGVAYSHDPVDLLNEAVVINGVWGLGTYAVDGEIPPDLWVFTRDAKPMLARRKAGRKTRMLAPGKDGKLVDRPVPDEQQRVWCLTEGEAADLARQVLHIETTFGCWQDVEWARNRQGELIFLQSRPFSARSATRAPKPPLLTQYQLLASSPDIACRGVGCGPVVKPQTKEELAHFPVGGILVAAHSSAEYSLVMDRAQGVIAEAGGVTGHMASICREFHVPCLVNVHGAMSTLETGAVVTMDAFNGYVYAGEAEELLPLRLNLAKVRLEDTPVLTLLRQAARLIIPLNLTDPDAASFSPAHCDTVHDIMRFAHEQSYREMFAISDQATDAGGVALKLVAPLPIDLHIIDLDRGASVKPGARSVKPEEILCAPLNALLRGMLRPDTMFRAPRPVSMSGFFSVMGQQVATPQGGERFGDKSYAIISDRYMNFSSRVGYHYSVLDAYCGATESKNYISFAFQGGAAGETRRIRRCQAIALVLEALGFTVVRQKDAVKSRFQKYPREVIEDRMDQLGRLLQVTRQMDMLMVDDASIAQFKENFMQGVYY